MGRFARLAVTATAALLIAVPAALADSCGNLSRAPAACGTACTSGPIIEGNWVWLPSVEPGAPPIWGFNPPGAPESVLGFPDANGNHAGDSLLDMSALCNGNGNATNARQSTNGIQSGCE